MIRNHNEGRTWLQLSSLDGALFSAAVRTLLAMSANRHHRVALVEAGVVAALVSCTPMWQYCQFWDIVNDIIACLELIINDPLHKDVVKEAGAMQALETLANNAYRTNKEKATAALYNLKERN